MHESSRKQALASPWRVGAEFRPRLNSMNNLVRNPTKFSGTSTAGAGATAAPPPLSLSFVRFMAQLGSSRARVTQAGKLSSFYTPPLRHSAQFYYFHGKWVPTSNILNKVCTKKAFQKLADG